MAEVHLSDEALEIVHEKLAERGEPAPVFGESAPSRRLREAFERELEPLGDVRRERRPLSWGR